MLYQDRRVRVIPTLHDFFKEQTRLPKKRNEGRRASDHERTYLRQLEIIVRNFITHFEDHPKERFAPRTRRMVKEAGAVFKGLDRLRAPRPRKTGRAASPLKV